MKILPVIMFILITINLFGQIESRQVWPKSIQREFDLINKQNIDTVLVYYTHLGPWTNLPDSCHEISSVSILWIKNDNYYSKQLFCDSIATNNTLTISSKPFRFFLSHIKDFKMKDKYYKQTKNPLLSSSDVSEEYLILMTKQNNLCVNISADQRTNEKWNKIGWIKQMTKAIDITKFELNIK
jgi:hypothetical protein